MVLALGVTENPALPHEVRRFVAVLATGLVMFTLLVNGTTLRGVIRLLGLDRLSPIDRLLRDRVLELILCRDERHDRQDRSGARSASRGGGTRAWAL